jgi:hypothetical protein
MHGRTGIYGNENDHFRDDPFGFLLILARLLQRCPTARFGRPCLDAALASPSGLLTPGLLRLSLGMQEKSGNSLDGRTTHATNVHRQGVARRQLVFA